VFSHQFRAGFGHGRRSVVHRAAETVRRAGEKAVNRTGGRCVYPYACRVSPSRPLTSVFSVTSAPVPAVADPPLYAKGSRREVGSAGRGGAGRSRRAVRAGCRGGGRRRHAPAGAAARDRRRGHLRRRRARQALRADGRDRPDGVLLRRPRARRVRRRRARDGRRPVRRPRPGDDAPPRATSRSSARPGTACRASASSSTTAPC
jgi:hypothetical protein